MTAVPAPQFLADPQVAAPGRPEIRLVPATGPIPEGAVVLGHVVAVPPGSIPPDAAGPRKLVAVPPPGETPYPATGPHLAGGPHATGGAVPENPHLRSEGPRLLLDRAARRVVSDGRELMLTRREYELLEHLMTHPGRVFTRKQLLTSVWARPDVHYGPPRTVDVHVSRLRRKLGPHGGALQSLRGVGYRWSERARPATI